MMEKFGDKLRTDKDSSKHEGFHKEKSRSPFSPFSGDETSGDRSMIKSSPDVNNMVTSGATGGRNGYSSSSSPSGSGGGGGVVCGGGGGSSSSKMTSTKNIGVGANLNNILNSSNPVARQLRLATNSSSSSSSASASVAVVNSRALPTSHSPAALSIPNTLLPDMIQQSQQQQQLGRTLAVGLPGQSSTSPGLPTCLTAAASAAAAAAAAGGGGGVTKQAEIPSSANKIVSQNLNGTLAVTSAPTNDSELQLYRVLQRANLLNYFDVMIELGGDDVQQLCDAGEEEFLEIMALVGMASKPLHVRRLQKSLQEWMTQPHLFQLPMLSSHLPVAAFGPPLPNMAATTAAATTNTTTSSSSSSHESSSPQIMPIRPIPFHSGSSQQQQQLLQSSFLNPSELMKTLQSKLCSLRGGSGGGGGGSSSGGSNNETHGSNSSSPLGGSLIPNSVISLPNNNFTIMNNNSSSNNHLSQSSNMLLLSSQSGGGGGGGGNIINNCGVVTNGLTTTMMSSLSSSSSSSSLNLNGNNNLNTTRISPDQIIPSHFLEQRIRTRSEASSPASSTESPQLDSRTSLSPVPFLQDHEVQKLAETALQIIAGLPSSMIEPRLSAKKKICAEFDAVIRIPENDPNRMDVVRKYAAIYGRNDCKRKVAKPLTLHELTVNEASAQLCTRLPALLTRRDELFPLARQVVKDAGLPYASLSSNVSISLLPKTIKQHQHDDSSSSTSSKINPQHNNNNNNHHHNNNNDNGIVITTSHYGGGGNNGKRMKLHQDSRSTDSHTNESNSEDSSYPNDSASNLHQKGVLSRRITDRLFLSLEKSDPSTSPVNSIGALDMSNNSSSNNCDDDLPNDLTVKSVNTNNKCNLSNSSSSVRHSMANNIKSEPVS